MKLTAILGAIGAASDPARTFGVEIEGLEVDSRKTTPGDLFFAIPGEKADGHDFLEMARRNGAAGAVVSRRVTGCPLEQFVVPDTRRALALAACEFYGHPSRRMPLVGVTGTNGKTTIAYLVRQILASQGIKCGLLGTIRNIIAEDEVLPSELTTAMAHDIQQLLARIRERGNRAAVMEVSSHALDQHRTFGTRFEVAVFTNLTPDHLDYHHDMESYFRAKSLLFEGLDLAARTVIGWDDPYGERLAAQTKGAILTFGMKKKSNIRIVKWKPLKTGSRVELEIFGQRIAGRVKLIGGFNAYNVAAAAGAALALGVTRPGIQEALSGLEPVPGRMEPVEAGQPFSVLVDYAHTPDALDKALAAAREHTRGRLVSLFGCGGDRMKEKRGPMGSISIRLADYSVITSDNPRTENAESIIEQIVAGVKAAGGVKGKNYTVIPDRREAIRHALTLLKEGDTLLIAGKGHEDYQILPTGKIHFDDREEAREGLKELGYG